MRKSANFVSRCHEDSMKPSADVMDILPGSFWIETYGTVQRLRVCFGAHLPKHGKIGNDGSRRIFNFSGYLPGFRGASHVHLFGPVAISAPCGASMLCSRLTDAVTDSGIFSPGIAKIAPSSYV